MSKDNLIVNILEQCYRKIELYNKANQEYSGGIEATRLLQNIKEVLEMLKQKEYAEFVKMTEKEYNKLIENYGLEFTIQCITQLDNYKGSSGKRYKSDYRAILSWVVDKTKKGKPNERFTRGAIDANAVAEEIKKYS